MTALKENQHASGSRTANPLDRHLDKKLMAYIAAAGAAGVGLLATAQPAEARVVYTKSDIVVDSITAAKIDFNGDGITDVTIAGVSVGSYGAEINGFTPTGNGILNGGAPLFAGVPIGAGGKFTTSDVLVQFSEGRYGTFGSHGLWAAKTDRFLGVEFQINGATHYGWVRVSVKPWEMIVRGYAYETVPNKTINAGETNESVSAETVSPSLAPASMPATLGLLARGAYAVAIWRREPAAA